MSKFKIVISNIVVLNGGDGALLFGGIKILKAALGDDFKLTVFSTEPERSHQLYPGVMFRSTPGLIAKRGPKWRTLPQRLAPFWSLLLEWSAKAYRRGYRLPARLLGGHELLESLRIYSEADIVLSSGGTYLKEGYGMDTQIADYRMTRALGRPLGFLTQTLGPFIRPRYRSALRLIFEEAAVILLRDEASLKNIVDLGLPDPPVHLCADSAFALANVETLNAAALRKFPTCGPKIAVSVRSWSHFRGKDNAQGMEDYMNAIADAASRLVSEIDAEVTFVSTCQGVDDYTDDSAVAVEIIKRIAPEFRESVALIREHIRFDALMERLSDYDLVIATRMHMAILSLSSGTPALPIVAEFKTSELYRNLGLADWIVEIESVKGEQLAAMVVAMLESLPDIQPALMARVLEFRESSNRAGVEIHQYLTGSEFR